MPRSRLLLLPLLTCTLSACGLLTAPASIPYAVSQNAFIGLHGKITDGNDAPLDNVTVTARRSYFLWNANIPAKQYDTKAFITGSDFDFPVRRASGIEFTFHKDGYQDVSVSATPDGIEGPWSWPLNAPFHVALTPRNSTSTYPFGGYSTDLDFVDPAKPLQVNLLQQIFVKGPLPEGTPPRLLSASILPQKDLRDQSRLNPLDVNLPASITFRVENPDDGILLYTPPASNDPFWLMNTAPASGYSREFSLTAAQLRLMRDRSQKSFTNRFKYFFYRAGDYYGKGYFYWNEYGLDTVEGQRVSLALCIVFQPNKSRDFKRNPN